MKKKKKEEIILVCGPRRERIPMEIEAGWETEDCVCADCGAELMRRPDKEVPEEATIVCMSCASKRVASDPDPQFRITESNKEAVKALGRSPEELLEAVTHALGKKKSMEQQADEIMERNPLWLRLLKLWWRLGSEVAKIWYRSDLMKMAGINDSEFMRTLDKWRDHPAFFVRVVASRRWAKITWPNDDPSMHQDDARLMWGRKKEYE